MLDLHYWPTPNGKKVTIQLEECGVPCECPRCKSAYHRLMSIQRQMEERERRFARPSRHYVQYD